MTPQQQQPNECDVAYRQGKCDAAHGVRFSGELYENDGCTVAYARGYLDGNPTRDHKLARLMASPKEE